MTLWWHFYIHLPTFNIDIQHYNSLYMTANHKKYDMSPLSTVFRESCMRQQQLTWSLLPTLCATFCQMSLFIPKLSTYVSLLSSSSPPVFFLIHPSILFH